MILFNEVVVFGTLKKRYQRFFMEVVLPSGDCVIAHTPNTGSMLGLLSEGNSVLLTESKDPKRKTAYTAQAIKIQDSWVGINTHLPNKLVFQSLHHKLFSFVSHYQSIKREVAFGKDLHSRADFLFSESTTDEAPLFLEVKNVSLRVQSMAQFPDTVSLRAQKHILDLVFSIKQGYKAVLLFIIQRTDCTSFSPATTIDKAYGQLLTKAVSEGLLIKAFSAAIDRKGLRLVQELPCIL